MGKIQFSDASFEEAIRKLNTECNILQDIYDRFVNEVIVKSDKIDEFAVRAIELKEEISRLQDRLVTLKMKGKTIERLYSDAEIVNLRLVRSLPDGNVPGAKTVRNGGAFPGAQIQNRYRTDIEQIQSSYRADSEENTI